MKSIFRQINIRGIQEEEEREERKNWGWEQVDSSPKSGQICGCKFLYPPWNGNADKCDILFTDQVGKTRIFRTNRLWSRRLNSLVTTAKALKIWLHCYLFLSKRYTYARVNKPHCQSNCMRRKIGENEKPCWPSIIHIRSGRSMYWFQFCNNLTGQKNNSPLQSHLHTHAHTYVYNVFIPISAATKQYTSPNQLVGWYT